MSSSPKYSSVRVDAQRQSQLAALQRQREAERLRQAEEARRKRLDASRVTADARAAELSRTLEDLAARASDGDAQAVLANRPAVLAHSLGELRRRIQTAPDQATLASVRMMVSKVGGEVQSLVSNAALAVARSEREHAMTAVAAPVMQLDRTDAARFDPDGAAAVAGLLQALVRLLSAGDTAEFDRRLPAAAEAARVHALGVVESRAAWDVERQNATEAVEEAAGQWAAQAADADTLGMDGWGRLARELDVARQALATGHHAEAHRVATEVAGFMAAAGRELDQRLADLERHLMIATAAADASLDLGMEVSRVEARPDGSVVLRLGLMNGDEVTGLVTNAGTGGDRLLWRPDALDGTEEAVDGVVERTCDLAPILERLHVSMGPKGLDMGPLDWQGRPDSDRPGRVQALPLGRAGAPTTRTAE